nr:hypothetical protein [Bradyrhizobium symbiodeficiens]
MLSRNGSLLRVLLVDDDPVNREVGEAILNRLGIMPRSPRTAHRPSRSPVINHSTSS